MNELFKKLQYKGSDKILVLNAPDEFQPQLAAIADRVRVDTQPVGDERYDFVMVFVKSCAEVQANAEPAVKRVKEDALLWFAYPKKSSKKYKTDLGRDDGWQPLGVLGYEGVRMIAIDDDWSAFRVRHVSKIKSLTRSEKMALSDDGKQRAKKG
ncbi:MAG: hypothetical protein DYG89_23740 [Caldilinea sp. CFX5]|nr:hypothetical protein [Caldilinea sp. CFX5]